MPAPIWNNRPSKAVRIPLKIFDQVLEYARKLDSECLITDNSNGSKAKSSFKTWHRKNQP